MWKYRNSDNESTKGEMKLSEHETKMNWLLTGVDFEARRIEIRGEISENMISIVTRAVIEMDKNSSKPIEIILSSPGGDAYEGLALFDFLRSTKSDIHIHASGKIMSAGFVIFLAGDVRTASKHTSFMMHSVSYASEGSAKEHAIAVNEGNRINNLFLDIAQERSKRNKKWWNRTILNHDRYFSVAEAQEIGILTSAKVVEKPKLPKAGGAKKAVKKLRGK